MLIREKATYGWLFYWSQKVAAGELDLCPKVVGHRSAFSMLTRCAQWWKAVPELPRVFVVPERKGCQGVGAAHSEARTRPLDAPEVTQTLRGWGAGRRPKAE